MAQLKPRLFLTFSVFFFIFFQTNAQITPETYQRAAYYLSASVEKEIYHLEVIPNWDFSRDHFFHSAYTADGLQFFITDISSRQTATAFDPKELAIKLSEKTGEKVDARNLPIQFTGVRNEHVVTFRWKNMNWTWDTKSGSLNAIPFSPRNENESFSPDKKWKAFTQNYNLFVQNLESGEQTQLTFDGKKGLEYASYYGWSDLIKGENGERPNRFMVSWSPDSKKIFTQLVDFRTAEKMYLLDHSQPEKFRAELYSYYRGSPGDSTVVNYIPVLIDLETQKTQLVHHLTTPHFIGINLRWESDSKSLVGYFLARGYKSSKLIELDAEKGSIRTVTEETSDTHIQRDKTFRKLSDGRFIESEEKSGWNHLYLHDWNTGKELNPITSGDFAVTKLSKIDEEKGWIYFEASGREKDRNPYYHHLYRVRLDGSDLTLLTPEEAHHEIYISPNGNWAVDNFSTPSQPTQSYLIRLETGEKIMKISEADISNLKKRGYQAPVQFTALAKDRKTEIHGIYFLPSTFSAKKKYPIIDYTYTGPHTSTVPKSFKNSILGHQQATAELGFVVVTVDGLGGFGRSKEFADYSYRNLGDGTTDHVLAITQLASKNRFLDITRVGIFGHSAGGYDAGRAMLLHPDFYKVGVASAGDHDFRMEKAWWPEMYMGYPVGDFYHEQSNITNAGNLKGRLLLAHGGMDENVNPSATFKLAEALIQAGKDFDLFIWPSRNHSFGRTPGDYFTKKRWDYFIQHLLGEQPLMHYQIPELRR